MTLRLLAAIAVGVFADLFAMGDAYSYSARIQQFHVTAFGCAEAAVLLIPAVLNFGMRRTFAIALAVWAGMIVAHTVVLIWETSRDPTSHNLWPFEYMFLLVLAIPAWIGTAAGRLADAVWVAHPRNKA